MQKISRKPKKISVTLFFNNTPKQSISSIKLRRVLAFIQRAKKLKAYKYYLKVIYPQMIDVFGNMVSPVNDGEYNCAGDFAAALKIFLED